MLPYPLNSFPRMFFLFLLDNILSMDSKFLFWCHSPAPLLICHLELKHHTFIAPLNLVYILTALPQIRLHMHACSVAQSCPTLWPHGQAPMSMGFSKQEYWSGLPFPPPGDLPDPGIEPVSPAMEADSKIFKDEDRICLGFGSPSWNICFALSWVSGQFSNLKFGKLN